MTKVNKKGLTYKQELVIEDISRKIQAGKKPEMLESFGKFYDTSNRRSLHTVKSTNLNNPNFRAALIDSLMKKNILGKDSATEKKLIEGLDAEDSKGNVEYDIRLRYIQEINKIAGVYAPEKRSTLNLNLDLTEEQLDKNIEELQEQLK